jgi:PAS domain S-box-containing protein
MNADHTPSAFDAMRLPQPLARFPRYAVAVFDRDYRCLFAEGSGLDLAGLDTGRMVGRRLVDIFPADRAAFVAPYFRRAFDREAVTFELILGPYTYEVQVAPVEDDALTIVVAKDVTESGAELARLRLLGELGDALAASLNVEETLAVVARLIVPRLADWCAIHLLGDDGEIERIAITHVDPSSATLAHQMVEGYEFNRDADFGPALVMRTGEPLFNRRVTDDMLALCAVDPRQLEMFRRVGMTSSIVVPLMAHGLVSGTISLSLVEPRGSYDEDDFALAERVARRAGLAIENAHLYRSAQRELARREREENGQRLRLAALSHLSESTVIGFVTGNEQRILETNEVFLRMLGYEQEDFGQEGLDWRAMTPPEYLSLDDRAIQEMLATGSSTPFEKEYWHRDGSRVPVLIGGTLLEREPVRWVCFVVDLSARRALEAMQQALMEDIGHDLRNPIAVTRWMTQQLRRLLQGAPLNPATVDEGLASIEHNTAHMVSLVDELMDIARMRPDQPIRLHLGPTDLVALARHSVDGYRQATHSHTFALETVESTLVGNWDLTRLIRVLDNLLSNAVKYSPQGGPVVVSIARAGDWAIVAVRDEGIGISQADRATMYDRFVRGVPAARVSGLGIGLAGVKQIVEQHGGTIEIESQEGRGSTFTVRLPFGEGALPH